MSKKSIYDKVKELESQILKIELYLITKVISGRKEGYRPCEGDEDQPLRDKIKKLRKKMLKLKNHTKKV